MVKTINVSLDDSDYELIAAAKGDRTWQEYLLDCVKGSDKRNNAKRKELMTTRDQALERSNHAWSMKRHKELEDENEDLR